MTGRGGFYSLVDVAPQALERGVSQIGKGLERLVSKGKLAAEERDQALSRLSSHGELAALERADLVVEAVVEKLEVKREKAARRKEDDGLADEPAEGTAPSE